MAEFMFLATDDDCVAIWSFIFDLGMTAYPNPWFGKLPTPALRTRADVAAHLEQYPRVAPALSYFLTSPEWSLETLEYRLCKNNPNFEPHWNVSQRYGGPSIHFIPRFGYPWYKALNQVITGMFGDFPYYYSTSDSRQIIERPLGLSTTMKVIRQKLRSHGKDVRSPVGRRAIALHHALAAHEAGAVLGNGDIVYTPITSGRRATDGR